MPCLHPQCYERGSVWSATRPRSAFYFTQTLQSSKGFRTTATIRPKSFHSSRESPEHARGLDCCALHTEERSTATIIPWFAQLLLWNEAIYCPATRAVIAL